MIREVIADAKKLAKDIWKQDFAFLMAATYLIFSYLRPQAIYPALNFLPWTQLSILAGLAYLGLKGQLRFQLLHFTTLIFFLVIVASCYNSLYPDISFSKLDIFFIWMIEIFFFTNCIRNLEQFRLITILFFVILFKISLFGAKTWIFRGFGFSKWGIAGPPGFFANSGELSLIMAMLAVMSLGFILGHSKVQKIYFILPITAIMTVLAASSRGGQLALAIGLLFIAVFIGKLSIKNIFIIAIATYLSFTFLPEQQKARFSSMGEDGTSTSRLTYWRTGLEMLEEHPSFGVGFYAFPEHFSDNYSYQMNQETTLGKRKEVAHNSFIEVGSGLGYAGLACYCFLIIYCFKLNAYTRKTLHNHWVRQYSIGLDIATITYLVGSTFMSVAFYPYLYLLLMFSQSLKNSVVHLQNHSHKRNEFD